LTLNGIQYRTYADIHSSGLELIRVSARGPNDLFVGLDGVCSYLGYNSSGVVTSIDGMGEGVNPLIRVGQKYGVFSSGVPSWLLAIANSNNPWVGITSSTTMGAGIQNCVKHFLDGSVTLSDFSNTLNEPVYNINSLQYKSHQSYSLRPTHISTVTNY
jgi:hypothetical protein